MGLLDKFKNKPFPEWMRKMKAEEQIEKERQAALKSMKNVPPQYDWSQIRQSQTLKYDQAMQDMSRIVLRRASSHFSKRHSSQFPEAIIRSELKNFIKNPLKLKLSAGLKRKLRREKAKYKQIREWMDDVERAVNEAVFGDSDDER